MIPELQHLIDPIVCVFRVCTNGPVQLSNAWRASLEILDEILAKAVGGLHLLSPQPFRSGILVVQTHLLT